jgi:hypothetical protein
MCTTSECWCRICVPRAAHRGQDHERWRWRCGFLSPSRLDTLCDELRLYLLHIPIAASRNLHFMETIWDVCRIIFDGRIQDSIAGLNCQVRDHRNHMPMCTNGRSLSTGIYFFRSRMAIPSALPASIASGLCPRILNK